MQGKDEKYVKNEHRTKRDTNLKLMLNVNLILNLKQAPGEMHRMRRAMEESREEGKGGLG